MHVFRSNFASHFGGHSQSQPCVGSFRRIAITTLANRRKMLTTVLTISLAAGAHAAIPAQYAAKAATLRAWSDFYAAMTATGLADIGGTCKTNYDTWLAARNAFDCSAVTCSGGGLAENERTLCCWNDDDNPHGMAAITASTPFDKLDDQCRDYNTPLGHSGSTDQYECCSVCGSTANRDYAQQCTAAQWTHRTICNMENNEDGNAPLPAGYECDAGPIAFFDGQWEDDNDNEFPGPDCSQLDVEFAAGRDPALVWADFWGEDKSLAFGQMAEANTFLIRANVAGAQVLFDQSKVKCVLLLEPVCHGVLGAFDTTNTPTMQAVSTTNTDLDVRIYNPSLMSTAGQNMTYWVDGPNGRSSFISGNVTVVAGYNEAEIALFTPGATQLQGLLNVGKVLADGAGDVFIADTTNTATGTVDVTNTNVVLVNISNAGTVNVSGGVIEMYDVTSSGDITFDGGTVTMDGVTNELTGAIAMLDGTATASGAINAGEIAIMAGTISLSFASCPGSIHIEEGVTGTLTLESGGTAGSCIAPSTVTVSGGFSCDSPPPPGPPAPPPPPPASSSSSSPPSSSSSGESEVSYVSVAFTSSGDVSDIDDTAMAAIQSTFAAEAGVSASAVTVTVASASIVITVAIEVPTSAAQSTASTLSTGIMVSATYLTTTLSVAGVNIVVDAITVSPTVSTTDPNAADGDGGAPCFPSHALVTKADGSRWRIDALKEGDSIVAATMEGALTHDTVSLLSIAKPEARDVAFLTLTTADAKNLTLTPGHHVPVGAACCATLKKAADVRVGDTVYTLGNSVWGAHDYTTLTENAAVAAAVTKVTKNAAAGLHSPVLTSGSFPIVDGVVTSFDSIEKVTLAKYGLAPLLAACKPTGTCESFREMFLGADRQYVAKGEM